MGRRWRRRARAVSQAGSGPMKCAICIAILATAALASSPASAQSLYRDSVTAANIFADHRARAVNDIVTIIVTEQSTQTRSATTKTSKDTSRPAAINDFPGLAPTTRNLKAADYLKFDISGKASHEGKGEIDRSDSLTTQIPARVVKVLENGNLVIEGR